MVIELKDNYKICPPMQFDAASVPLIDAYLETIGNDRWWLVMAGCEKNSPIIRKKKENAIKRLIHATRGTIAMRMLAVYGDDEEHHFDEMAAALHIPQGNDIDCWRLLREDDLITLSSKHRHGKMYYRITSLGKLVISYIEANDVFYRVIRWFKTKDQDSIYENMLTADVNGEDCAFEDVSDENVLKMVKALLDTSSVLYKIGSVYKWMNTFMYMLKSSSAFYEHVNIPAVNAWLDSNMDLNAATKSFYPKWKRIQKKWLKKHH